MKRTSAGVLLGVAGLGGIAGFVIDQLFTMAGRPTFTPSLLLPVLLVLLGASVVLLALPVRRAARGVAGARVDPFQAMRVAMLAKASSIVGAAVAGVGAGLLVFLATRPVAPSVGSMSAVALTIAGAAVLTAAALIAEQLCTIRKDDDDDQPGPPEPGLGLSHHD